jgi:hypothetical protein
MRLPRYLKIGLSLVAIILAAWWYLNGSLRWKSLPNGGKVCVLAITHGIDHQFRDSGRSLLRGLSDSLRTFSLRPLNSSGAFYTYGGISTQPEIHAFLGFEKASYVDLYDVRMVLPDGQSFGAGGVGSQAVGEFNFKVMPTRCRTFKITAQPNPNKFSWNQSALEWELDNPAFLSDPPAWEAEPLPVTKSDGPLSVTIRNASIETSPRRPYWKAKFDTAIQWNGTPAEDWFVLRHQIAHPGGSVAHDCGLISEPVWRIDYEISETAAFPFADEDVQWIGTTPSGLDAEKPGTFLTFPIAPQMRSSGLKSATFLAPGVYDVFVDGTVRVSASPANALRKGDFRYNTPLKDKKGTFGRLQIDEPSILVISDISIPLLLHFKNSANTTAPMRKAWYTLLADFYPRIYPLPAPSLRFGIAKPNVRKLQFFISAPKLPPNQ